MALVCFLGSMIACVVLADGWGGPPEVCDRYSVYYQRLDCDHSQLEGTNGTAAVSPCPPSDTVCKSLCKIGSTIAIYFTILCVCVLN